MHGDGSSVRWAARTLAGAIVVLLVGLLAAARRLRRDGSDARDRRRRRREVVGGRRQRVAPDAARPFERPLRDRPPGQHRGQPGAAAPPVDEGPLRLVRGALPARVPRRDDSRGLGPRPARVRATGHDAARGRPPRGAAASSRRRGRPPTRCSSRTRSSTPGSSSPTTRTSGTSSPTPARIVANGFPPAVLMIDEGWAEGYGVWDFHRGRFPDPKAMMDELHADGLQGHGLGLPVHPARREAVHGAPPRRDAGRVAPQREGPAPAGDHALVGRLQRRHRPHEPRRTGVVQGQLRRLVDAYGVDGFKLDGGDAELFAQSAMLTGAVALDASATPNRHTEAFAQIGLALPAQRVPRLLEDGRPAARPAAAGQGAHLGGPAEARPRHRQPGAHGIPVRLPRPDRRRGVPVVPEPRGGRPGADRPRGRRSTRSCR